jgi:Glycosyl transferase family 2
MSSERPTTRSGAVTAASDAPAPAVSVIIPAYGVTQYIAETLDSVFAQTFRDFEVIVVNDGCPDSAALETALRPYRERIVYIRKENGGCSSARNAGIRAARAPLIALLDGDDAWLPDFLAVQTDYLRSHPHTDIIYCNGAIFGDTPLAGRSLMELSPSRGEVTFESLALFRCSVNGPSVVARKAAILAVGGFDESLRRVEDFDLWLRAAHGGARISYHRRRLFRYRQRATSLSADGIAMAEAALRVLDQLEQTLQLSASQKSAVEGARQAFQARIAYLRMKEALNGSDAQLAQAAVGDLLQRRRTVKFALLALGLRWLPHLTMRVARWRQR